MVVHLTTLLICPLHVMFMFNKSLICIFEPL